MAKTVTRGQRAKSGSKASETKASETKAAAEKKAAEKAEREAASKAKREAKEQERAAARKELVDSGNLIVDGDTEFHKIERDEKKNLEIRAAGIIETLKTKGTKVPVSSKSLQDEFGGGVVQYVAIFGVLKELGLVEAYRSRTGERGGSGVAYLWVG